METHGGSLLVQGVDYKSCPVQIGVPFSVLQFVHTVLFLQALKCHTQKYSLISVLPPRAKRTHQAFYFLFRSPSLQQAKVCGIRVLLQWGGGNVTSHLDSGPNSISRYCKPYLCIHQGNQVVTRYSEMWFVRTIHGYSPLFSTLECLLLHLFPGVHTHHILRHTLSSH